MNLINMDEETERSYNNEHENIQVLKWKEVFCEEKVMLMHDLKNHINEKVYSIET